MGAWTAPALNPFRDGVVVAAVPLQRSVCLFRSLPPWPCLAYCACTCVSRARSGRTTYVYGWETHPATPHHSLLHVCMLPSKHEPASLAAQVTRTLQFKLTSEVRLWIWTPILKKRGRTTLLGEFPELPSNSGILLGCGRDVYVMRPYAILVWRPPEFLAGRSRSPSRRSRVTIHLSIPLRFDTRNDGLRPVGGWDVLAAHRSSRRSAQEVLCTVFCFLLLGFFSW